MRLFCKLTFHKWKIVRDTGKTVYRQCELCPKRDVFQRSGGYQPIDRNWMKNG